MTEPLTYKLPLPPIVPRDHFSGEGEDVRFESEPVKRRSKPWIDANWSDANDNEEGVPV
jgi:hypothetical protein